MNSIASVALMTASMFPVVWVAAPVIGAKVESAIAPVIADQHVEFLHRGDELAGWVWRYRKLRDVPFTTTDATIDTDDPRDRISGELLVCDNGGPRYLKESSAEITRSPPVETRRALCVDIRRARIKNHQPVTVTASITYRPAHGLWLLTYSLPVVHFPPRE